jgi:hypothetical protein
MVPQPVTVAGGAIAPTAIDPQLLLAGRGTQSKSGELSE